MNVDFLFQKIPEFTSLKTTADASDQFGVTF